MKKKILLVVLVSILVTTSAQAMSNYPSTLVLKGNANEWVNGTIYFSDVPTDTLTGYEKWTVDGKNLNISLKASDLNIELIYPKVVEVKDGKAVINISAKTEKAGNYTGAIFYRTSEQMSISAGTWIEINVASGDLSKDICQSETNNIESNGSRGLWLSIQQIWKKFWSWVDGLFPIAGASNVSMNTTVTVLTPIPYYRRGGGGGNGGSLGDTDGDSITDGSEITAGTDPNNPCDPNPKCTACLALKSLIVTPTVTPTIEIPIKQPTISPMPIPTPSPTPKIPILVVEKPFQWKFIAIPIGIIIAVVLFLVWRRREAEDEEEYSY